MSITPPPEVKLSPADWQRSFRMMRLHGLSNAVLDQLREFFPDNDLRNGLKDIRYNIKPLIFDKPKAKASKA